MENIFGQCLDNKTILEIGTGRGGTTRELVLLLSKFENCRLITTDIVDDHFSELKDEFKDCNVNIDFIKTNACCLEGIKEESIDYLVCNYTLCAINSNPSCEVLALNKFKSVLKTGGELHIEEEFPINHIENEMQEIWSKKWKVLKSCTSLLGEGVYNEMDPEVLKNILIILGFKNIKYKNSVSKFSGENCLDFFNLRLNKYLKRFENKTYVKAMEDITAILNESVKKSQGMEIPSYYISAVK